MIFSKMVPKDKIRPYCARMQGNQLGILVNPFFAPIFEMITLR